MQYVPRFLPVSLEVTSLQVWPGGQGNSSPRSQVAAQKQASFDFTQSLLPAPQMSEFVLNQAYRLFPDSAAARGLSDAEAKKEQKKLPTGSVDLARKMFAQVFSGVHW